MDKGQLIAIIAAIEPDVAETLGTVLADSLPLRELLPNKRRTERESIRVKEQEVFVEVGFYEDNRPAEIFLKAGKVGSDVQDIFDALATVLSISLQYGIPLSAFPITGRGNVVTGEGNELIDAIIMKVEELCSPATRSGPSPSSTGSTTPQ